MAQAHANVPQLLVRSRLCLCEGNIWHRSEERIQDFGLRGHLPDFWKKISAVVS